MNNEINETSTYQWSPFLFHYIIVFICAAFIVCVCILKFKYLYWYSQPITFGFTIRRWFRGGGTTGRCNTVMNPLSLATRCNNAIVYPFLHHVRHDIVRVYGGGGGTAPISDAPYERIAEFLSRRDTESVAPFPSDTTMCIPSDTLCIPSDTLEFILSQETHGLSVFIGILTDKGDNTPIKIKGDNTPIKIKGDNTPIKIKGVCILTPRIMLSFSSSSSGASGASSVSIYVCDHLAWAKYITPEYESLALLETTEYIQKSREIAGEQTLYRYREIPWFVVPFTTVYTYTFAARNAAASAAGLGAGLSVVPVSTTNFAIFYAFVNECVRDFRCGIFNELTQLQSLIQGGIYRIYMLLLNRVRVIAAYIFAPSWMKVREGTAAAAAAAGYTRNKTKPKKTIGNRITALHDRISQTSTAVVKYLPPVVQPKYDAFGKRVKRAASAARNNGNGDGDDILLLISSIQHKSLCARDAFVRGFYAAAGANTFISIDTIAHNYRIIDAIVAAAAAAAHWNLLSREKWYYILYNAIIHQETLCKDILII